jgi:N utilization substance protein B
VREHTLRQARQLALEALYEAETSSHDPVTVYERRLRDPERNAERMERSGADEAGRRMVRGVLATRAEADGLIAQAAPKFPVRTLAIVDRNILRLAIWELLSDTSAPVPAVVNEAVDLAHRYGGEASPAFVNGVLRTVSATIVERRPAPVAPGTNSFNHTPGD